MARNDLDLLLSELRAIELWDKSYALEKTHDEIDRSAWKARRDRQAAIIAMLIEVELVRLALSDLN